jgi:hypothetical protein
LLSGIDESLVVVIVVVIIEVEHGHDVRIV